MRQYTTPTVRLRVKDESLIGTDVYVTLRYGKKRTTMEIPQSDITLTEDGNDTLIKFTLTQEQTAKFSVGDIIEYEVNYMSGHTRPATDIAYSKPVKENLLKRILP